MLSIPDKCRLLHGPYRSPICALGKRLKCRIRGRVEVKRIGAGPIFWPQAVVGRNRAFMLCGDLVRAVRRESEVAIIYWWGVTPQTVRVWRKALGVGATTEGTSRLRRENFSQPWAEEAKRKAWAKAGDPERRAKIAATKRGKPRPPHVIEAMRRGRTGKPHSAEARRKMCAAQRRRGTWPPAAGRPWTEKENARLGTMPDEGVAERTGRTVGAVRCRRCDVRVPPYRARAEASHGGTLANESEPGPVER